MKTGVFLRVRIYLNVLYCVGRMYDNYLQGILEVYGSPSFCLYMEVFCFLNVDEKRGKGNTGLGLFVVPTKTLLSLLLSYDLYLLMKMSVFL